MPSIFTAAQPAYGRVLIQVNFTDTGATFARVQRLLSDGTLTVVRPNTFSDSSGDYIELSGGQAILYDTEAPLDVPLIYITDGLIGTVAAGTATDTPPGEVLASGEDLWLKAPLRPWADQRVVLEIPQEPDCLPESAIFFVSMDIEVRGNRTTVAVINNRKNPIAMTRTRGGIASTLNLVTRRFADRDAVITLNADGDVLFFEGPAAYAIPDQYMSVGDYSVSRLSTDHRRQWRLNALPYVEVDRPAGLAEGILGDRWADLCQKYLTFAAATAAGLTWTSVLLGLATNSPPPAASIWIYATIPVQYATYTALNAAFPTYNALWQGPF
jgi:hypothetical protein